MARRSSVGGTDQRTAASALQRAGRVGFVVRSTRACKGRRKVEPRQSSTAPARALRYTGRPARGVLEAPRSRVLPRCRAEQAPRGATARGTSRGRTRGSTLVAIATQRDVPIRSGAARPRAPSGPAHRVPQPRDRVPHGKAEESRVPAARAARRTDPTTHPRADRTLTPTGDLTHLASAESHEDALPRG